MIKDYLQRIAECRTLNELNSARIKMSNMMTPVEAVGLFRAVTQTGWRFPSESIGVEKADRLHNALVQDVARVAKDLELAGKRRVERFGRRRLAHGVTLYSDGRKRSAKTLLIAFTGNAGRLMMPIAVVLQNLDSISVDLALLKDNERDGYRRGLEGVGEGIEAMIDALPKLLSAERYRRLAVIGTSGGGLPALLTGLRLQLEHAVSVGGNGPDDPRWDEVGGKTARELLSLAAQGAPATRATLVFGAQSPRDQAAAEAMAEVVPANLLPISDPEGDVGHVALYPLVRQRQLAGFLRRHLGL